MFDAILIPTDGSRAAEHAGTVAIELAGGIGAAVHVVTVTEPTDLDVDLEEVQHEELVAASVTLGGDPTSSIAEAAADAGVPVSTATLDGLAHVAIAEYAAAHDIDLVIMGTHGHAETRLGSTTERVLLMADQPVLAVPFRTDDAADADDRIVMATDGSDLAAEAAAVGFELATATGDAVSVCYVLDTTIYHLEDAPRSIIGLLETGGRNAVDALAVEGREQGLSVQTEVRRGSPAEEIVAFAEAVDARLLVLGSRGRGGIEDRFLGSTAARVLRRAPRPILVVP